jgi:hypothetical protein
MRLLISGLFTVLLLGQIPLKYEKNETPTYDQAIHWYQVLDTTYDNAHLLEYGETDSGKPLHLFVISSTPGTKPDPISISEQGKSMLLIINAIHAGESCGVDASIRFAEDLLMQESVPDNVVIGIIPIYNIGGALIRNSTTRVNQNGPKEYGFRGNSRNLDLNRDFIKADSKNAKIFTAIFHEWKPDILIDTHTTNGADFQHVITFLGSNPQNYPPTTKQFIKTILIPGLYSSMKKKGFPIIPYVMPLGDTPESGLWAGIDPPRFSSGYAALFNTLAFISEAHMLKPYEDRVKSTLSFLHSLLGIMEDNTSELLRIKKEANNFVRSKDEFILTWEMDTTRFDQVLFLGYKAKYIPSRITGHNRLFYDRSSPYQKHIPVAAYSNELITVKRPHYYIIPQGWSEVIDRLELNQIQLYTLSKDTLLEGEMYTIDEESVPPERTNGHYFHANVSLKSINRAKMFYKGDFVVPLDQNGNRYIIEMLEPQGTDSFFRWNFFDSILDQREYFSPYGFEDIADSLLMTDIQLRNNFETKKNSDPDFAGNPWAQLNYIYRQSPYFEDTYRLYPIMRIINNVKLPLERR